MTPSGKLMAICFRDWWHFEILQWFEKCIGSRHPWVLWMAPCLGMYAFSLLKQMHYY